MTENFKKVIHGGALFSLGALSATLLQFVAGVIVIRIVEPAEFGLISLSYIISNILVTIAVFGFNNGVPHFLAKYRNGGYEGILGQVAGAALVVSFSCSVLFLVLQYGAAGVFASSLGKPGMRLVLEAFAFMVPPLTAMTVFSAIFRGLENSKAKVLFQDLLLNSTRVLLLLPVAVVVGLGYTEVLYIYVISVWVAFGAYFVYTYQNLIKPFSLSFKAPVAKEIVVFSLPLLGVGLMGQLMMWAGTLMLGILSDSEEVGLFNASLRLANTIPIPLMALVFMYLPLATRIISAGDRNELGKLFVSTTKWAFLLTLPLLLFFLLDAEFVVVGLFGHEYAETANVLRVLALGFSIHTFLGPNGTTLVSWGDTKPVFRGTALSATTAVILCFALIPRYGALGAAVAVAFALTLSNLYLSVILYMRFRVQPFTVEYIRLLALILIVSGLVFMVIRAIGGTSVWSHVLLFVLLIVLTMLAPIATRNVSRDDVEIVDAIESRLTGKKRIANWIRGRL